MNKPQLKDPLKPVYYFYGPEDYLIEEAVKSIRKEALTKGFEDLNYQAFDKENLNASSIIAAAETMPAFSDKRVIVVKDADSLKKDALEALSGYIKRPSPSTCLVFISNETKVDKGSGFFSLLSEKGFLKVFYRLKGPEIAVWIKKEASKNGKDITRSAAQKLFELSGEGLREIKGELEKIILFTGDKKTIEDSDVEEAGLDLKDETMFSLSDAIGGKDIKAALRIYAKLSTEPAPRLLTSIARQIRILLKIKALIRKKVPRERMTPALGVPPWQLEGYLRRSASFKTESELKRALMSLREADREIKTGKVPEKVLMSRMIMELCADD